MGFPGAIPVIVTAVEIIEGGEVRVTCVDPSTAERWDRVPVMSFGGTLRGSSNAPVYAPTGADARAANDGTEGILIPMRRGGVVFLGALATPGEVSQAPNVEASEDHSGDIGSGGWRFRAAGASLVIDDLGEVVITVPDGALVRAQLSKGGVFRVSRQGDAGGAPALAGPVRDQLEALRAKIDEVGGKLVTVGTAAGAVVEYTPVQQTPAIASSAVRIPSEAE